MPAAVHNVQCTTPLQSGDSECLEHTNYNTNTNIYNSVISSARNNVDRGVAPLLAGGGGGLLGRGSEGGHQRHGHARWALMALCIMTHYTTKTYLQLISYHCFVC